VIEVRELLRELVADGGSTVFMSSHILAEVDLLGPIGSSTAGA
jgi:ABC-type multidrug transport system ATPase subunit